MEYERVLNAYKARVLIDKTVAGILERIATDEYRFTYDEDYLKNPEAIPLSLSLPLQSTPTISEDIPAFFDNMLMEGRLVRRMSKSYGLDARAKGDRFKLLLLSAYDSIGAVNLMPIDERGNNLIPDHKKPLSDDFSLREMQSPYPEHCPICLEIGSIHSNCSTRLADTKLKLQLAIDEQQLEDTFRVLPAGSSISGAQDKNLFLVSKGVFLPSFHSTHIVKPEGDFIEMPANEHLTMTIARRAKFQVPPTALFRVEGIGLIYIIKRFDRNKNG